MKYFRLFLMFLITFSIVFTLSVGYKKIDEKKEVDFEKDYKCILSIWQIDTFEGGKGSRKQFLNRIARDFEKDRTGVLISVSDMTVEGANKKIIKGEVPDMISFGLGVEIANFESLKVDNAVKGGKNGESTYLTAWCKGNYCLIRNRRISKKKGYSGSLVVSDCEYTNPLLACSLESLDINFTSVKTKKPLDAYYNFVAEESEYLLGTQRDIERLKNREIDVEITPLFNYNDLIQYIAITKKTENIKYCEEYINYLVGETSQKKLNEISMFSCFYDIDYQDNLKILNSGREYLTISPFLKNSEIKEIKQKTEEAFLSNEKSILKIKNYLI